MSVSFEDDQFEFLRSLYNLSGGALKQRVTTAAIAADLGIPTNKALRLAETIVELGYGELATMGLDELAISANGMRYVQQKLAQKPERPFDDFRRWVPGSNYPNAKVAFGFRLKQDKLVSLPAIRKFLISDELRPVWQWLFGMPPSMRIDEFLTPHNQYVEALIGDSSRARFFKSGELWFQEHPEVREGDPRPFPLSIATDIWAAGLFLNQQWRSELFSNEASEYFYELKGTDNTVADFRGSEFRTSISGILRSQGRICNVPHIEISGPVERLRDTHKLLTEEIAMYFQVEDSVDDLHSAAIARIIEPLEAKQKSRQKSRLDLIMEETSAQGLAAEEANGGSKETMQPEGQRDVFICHASEDKEESVYPLLQALDRHGITYWVDRAEILWGDDITLKINEGLRIAKFVLVFISDSFLKKHWPQMELSSAIGREASTGKVVVLPLLLTSEVKVFEQYPILRSKRFEKFDVQKVDELAATLQQLLTR